VIQQVLPLVVQIVPSAWRDVNCCSVLLRAAAERFVILGRILDSPATEMKF
jgi:hypothetical protein